jgi:chromatin remodeling complex protein RSC6
MAKKVPFGGYGINFKGRSESLEQVFGKTKISPSEMTKKIWAFVKKHKLGGK